MQTIKVNQVDWQVEIRESSEDTGPVLLLVHGFPLDHRMWRHQLDAFENTTIVAPDLAGFGGSRLPKSPFSMESLADDLAAVLDTLEMKQSVVFCGLSMGGYIGWQFWRRHRERLAAMICCDTRAAADAPEVARGREMMAARVRSEGSAFVASGMIPKLFAARAIADATAEVQTTTTVIEGTKPEAIAQGQLAISTRADATAWLSEIHLPTLLVVGAEDQITTPEEMRGMARQMPKGRLIQIENAGHMAPLEQPAEFNQAVRAFLAEL